MSEQKTAPWQSLVDFIEDLCAREQPAEARGSGISRLQAGEEVKEGSHPWQS